MSRQIVAGRYAGALFSLAKQQDLLPQVEQDLKNLAQVLAGSEELKEVLQNKRIASYKKYQLMQELFGQAFQALTLNFIGVILEKRREEYLEDIIKSFERELDRHHGVMEAEIRTAVELPEEDRQALAEKLAKATGKQVRLRYRLDPGLMAGAVLKIGDKVIDGSVATRLKNLKAQLSG
ncbi:MAG TPA: F0F1 ATP synthase subunit delta [Clostridia bacterium]|nr:F0F1 ATP synthase subunit delta [Clostridia bacterium]